MFSRLPMFQRQGISAFKKDLTNINALCHLLDRPEKSFPSIHVAGTNGKGSTSHMIASVLQEAGYKVGLYTSPHLKDFRERIRVNGKPIDELSVIDFIARHHSFLETQGLSFFELTVGMAFQFFSNQQVDIAVIEVGLGGRLDSTNVIDPLVSVITNIGFDHEQYLGDTLQKIAIEKGGIIKPGRPVVIGEYQEEVFPVFEKIAKAAGAPLYIAEKLVTESFATDLLGNYQRKNVKTATQCIRLLREMNFEVPEEILKNGLLSVVENTGLRGRWQVLGHRPKVVCDTAHNKEGLESVMDQLRQEKYAKLHFVLGVVNDKKLENIFPLLPKDATYYFCKPDIPRGLPEEILQNEAFKAGLKGEAFDSVGSAYQKALQHAGENDFVYVGGSTFVVAELNL